MRKVVLIILFVNFLGLSSTAATLQSLQSSINMSCVSPMVLGPCLKPIPPYTGLLVSYWEPVLLIETVKNPGDTAIDDFIPGLKQLLPNVTKTLMNDMVGLPFSISSGSTRQSLSGTNLQFNEVHIYRFPFDLSESMKASMQCPNVTEALPPVVYLSELDSAEWRIGLFEALSPKSVLSASLGPVCSFVSPQFTDLCLGTWGAVYPRRGFFTHQSEVVGSAADVFRAVSNASFENYGIHKSIARIPFIPDPSKDRLQLIYPSTSGCINIGQNPGLWESGKTSLTGKYVWVYWRYRICCAS